MLNKYPAIQTAFTYMMSKQRKEKGYSYRTLAKKVGAAHSYIQNLEKGLYDTSMDIGLAVCKVLDIDIELFIDHMFQIKQIRMLIDIEQECEKWDIPLPIQFQRENFIPIQYNKDDELKKLKASV